MSAHHPAPERVRQEVRVLVFTDDVQKALAAGAGFRGLADMMKQVNRAADLTSRSRRPSDEQVARSRASSAPRA